MIRDHFLQRDLEITQHHRDLVRGWSNRYTPDIHKLCKYKSQLVFVCDEHMSDRRQHFVIEDLVEKKVVGFTAFNHNFLLHPDGQALPFRNSDGCKIKGEILQTNYRAILKLDKLKLNTVQFRRQRVPIFDPYRGFRTFVNGGSEDKPNDTFFEDGIIMPEALQGKKVEIYKEELHTQMAWMYVPVEDYWDYQVKRRPEIFNRVPTFPPKKEKTWLNGQYYKYQNPIELD